MAKKKKKKEDLRDKNLAYRNKRGHELAPPLSPPNADVPVEKPRDPITPSTGKPKPPVTKKRSSKGKGGLNSFLSNTSGMGPVSPQGTVPPRSRRGRGRRMGTGFGSGSGSGGGGNTSGGHGSGSSSGK